jgi:hypothetical protein
MAWLGKKSVDEIRFENIKYLNKLSSTANLLIQYAEGTEHIHKVRYLKEEIEYLLPIETEAIKALDKKINNALDDLKILLYTNRDPYRVKAKLTDLKQLLDERNTKI